MLRRAGSYMSWSGSTSSINANIRDWNRDSRVQPDFSHENRGAPPGLSTKPTAGRSPGVPRAARNFAGLRSGPLGRSAAGWYHGLGGPTATHSPTAPRGGAMPSDDSGSVTHWLGAIRGGDLASTPPSRCGSATSPASSAWLRPGSAPSDGPGCARTRRMRR
jgi:hypothetical protein